MISSTPGYMSGLQRPAAPDEALALTMAHLSDERMFLPPSRRDVQTFRYSEGVGEIKLDASDELIVTELTPTPYEATVMMKYPFVALNGGRTRDLSFPDASKKITLLVTTEREKNMAFVSDVSVLTWVVSELRERIHVRHEHRDDIVLSIARSKLLRYIGKKPGGAQHDDLATALERLCATRVKTNLLGDVTGSKVQSFALLERCERDDTDPADPVWTITPPQWLVDIVHQKNLVTRINPDSMKLRGIERCIYRYARATIGDSSRVEPLDPARAADRFGSDGKRAASTMRHRLKRLVKNTLPGVSGPIPDYTIVAAKDGIMIYPPNEIPL